MLDYFDLECQSCNQYADAFMDFLKELDSYIQIPSVLPGAEAKGYVVPTGVARNYVGAVGSITTKPIGPLGLTVTNSIHGSCVGSSCSVDGFSTTLSIPLGGR